MPAAPSPFIETVVVEVQAQSNVPSRDAVVSSRNHVIKPGGRVVINLPADFSITQPDAIEQRGDENLDEGTEFKTEQYFSSAEQQIERALISQGFNVLSREKFEAKLRDLRSLRTRFDYNPERDTLEGPAAEAMKLLKDKLNAGLIDMDTYLEQAKALDEAVQRQYGVGRSYRKAENEMTDVSELIRAAQDGEIRSDYLLQINKFSLFPSRQNPRLDSVRLNLLEYPQVLDLVGRFPKLSDEDLSSLKNVRCNVASAMLNAKLIDVSTGAIVWVGDHKTNSLMIGEDAPKYRVTATRNVSNERAMQSAVNALNTEESRKVRGASGATPDLPGWEFEETIEAPILISGGCLAGSQRLDEALIEELSGLVASALIRTIDDVSSGVAPIH